MADPVKVLSEGAAQDLIETPGWKAFLKVTFNELKTVRMQLLVSRDLTQENRMYYAGQIAGTYQVLRKVYEAAKADVPVEVLAFFKGEWDS